MVDPLHTPQTDHAPGSPFVGDKKDDTNTATREVLKEQGGNSANHPGRATTGPEDVPYKKSN